MSEIILNAKLFYSAKLNINRKKEDRIFIDYIPISIPVLDENNTELAMTHTEWNGAIDKYYTSNNSFYRQVYGYDDLLSMMNPAYMIHGIPQVNFNKENITAAEFASLVSGIVEKSLGFEKKHEIQVEHEDNTINITYEELKKRKNFIDSNYERMNILIKNIYSNFAIYNDTLMIKCHEPILKLEIFYETKQKKQVVTHYILEVLTDLYNRNIFGLKMIDYDSELTNDRENDLCYSISEIENFNKKIKDIKNECINSKSNNGQEFDVSISNKSSFNFNFNDDKVFRRSIQNFIKEIHKHCFSIENIENIDANFISNFKKIFPSADNDISIEKFYESCLSIIEFLKNLEIKTEDISDKNSINKTIEKMNKHINRYEARTAVEELEGIITYK